MRSIAAASAATRRQAPMPSRMRRLPFDSAVVRSSKLGASCAAGRRGLDHDDVEGQFAQRGGE
jgi:hypothetical protein